MINVTKTYLPPFEDYVALVKEAYDAGWITNNGKLVQRLEAQLKEYLGVKHLFFCTNGTITLQIAIKALGLKGEIITTPFSYVASTNSIVWENCNPVFVDIDPVSFCIDPAKIEAAITPDTTGILATHVYGMNCDIESIQKIADKYSLKVIYDAAHCFGARYNGHSLLSYGDVSSCSFHATKIFHTVEGGCLTTNDDAIAEKIFLYRQFGHIYDDYFSVGINAKNSEFHAAMGLAILKDVPGIIAKRKYLYELYNKQFVDAPVQLLGIPETLEANYAYYPVVFKDEQTLQRVKVALEEKQVFPRRYFYPSLNTLPFIPYQACPVSESISKRVLCLPLFYELSAEELTEITGIILQTL